MSAYAVIDGVPHFDGQPVSPAEFQSAVQAKQAAEAEAADALVSAQGASRTALAAVLSLAAAYPYADPAENAIVDAQAAAALDGYRSLAGPPADVVALAAAVVSWRAAL